MTNWMEQALNESQQDQKKKTEQQDILWITPKRLGVVFGIMLAMTLITENFV